MRYDHIINGDLGFIENKQILNFTRIFFISFYVSNYKFLDYARFELLSETPDHQLLLKFFLLSLYFQLFQLVFLYYTVFAIIGLVNLFILIISVYYVLLPYYFCPCDLYY